MFNFCQTNSSHSLKMKPHVRITKILLLIYSPWKFFFFPLHLQKPCQFLKRFPSLPPVLNISQFDSIMHSEVPPSFLTLLSTFLYLPCLIFCLKISLVLAFPLFWIFFFCLEDKNCFLVMFVFSGTKSVTQ